MCRSLNLSSSKMVKNDAKMVGYCLHKAGSKAVTENLNLSNNLISKDGMTALADSMQCNGTLKVLDVSKC